MDKTLEARLKLSSQLYAVGGSDHENFNSLLSQVFDAPKGVEVLTELADLNYKYIYQPMMGVNGACDHKSKTIMFDSYHTQSMLAPIFVHEGTHALQVSRYDGDIDKLNAFDHIKLHRAFEADACAHQSAYTYQMRESNPRAYDEAMKTPMMQAYVAEMEKSGDERKAMLASFEKWYDFKHYQESYEKADLGKLRISKTAADKDPDAGYLKGTISDKALSALLLHDGKPYVDPAFLSSPRAMAVSAKAKEELAELGDKTVEKLPVRDEKTVASKNTKTADQAKVAALAALKSRAR